MKAKELRTKYRIMITGVAMAALLAGTTACSSQASTGSSTGAAAAEATAGEASADGAAAASEAGVAASYGNAEGGSQEDSGEAEGDGTASSASGTDEEQPTTAAGETTATDPDAVTVFPGPAKDAVVTSETIDNAEDGGHAILADGESASYANTLVTKTGSSDSGDEADFYGDNAAVFATNGATLDLTEMIVETDGTHANGVFSYGEGTTVNISDSCIETSGNCSGGLMTTGGGIMNAEDLTITTSGNSSAAIRSDRGGGTVNVTGGTYTTSGTGSPVIYSTADITVSSAELESTASQGVVVEGRNSVTLNNVDLTADNNTKNSDKSAYYQAVMIYQSMSGDAAEGTAAFTMSGGTLTNANGDVFFVNNTATSIDLDNVLIVNNGDGVFLRAAAAGWGSEGSNGGHVNLTASNQEINGDMVVDEVSELNLYLKEDSTFIGAINPDGGTGSSADASADGTSGSVYVEIEEGSKWVLTGDSYVTSLTCGADAIDLNGYTLYVGGQAYEAGSESTGEAIEFTVSTGNGQGGGMTPPDGAPNGNGGATGEMPGGAPDGQGGPGGTPPQGGPGGSGSADSGVPGSDSGEDVSGSSGGSGTAENASGSSASNASGTTSGKKQKGSRQDKKPSKKPDGNSNNSSNSSTSGAAEGEARSRDS